VEKIPFVALAFVMGFIATRNAVETGSVDTDVFYSQTDRIVFGFNNLMMYVVKSIIPFKLSGYYQYPDLTGGGIPTAYYYSIAVILLIGFAVFYSLKHTKHVLFAGGFFVAAIVLVLQIFPVGPTLFSERYSYIPSFGLNFLIGIGMVNLIQFYGNSAGIKALVYTVTGVYSVWLITYTRQRCEVWKDSISFWTDVISADAKVPVAFNNRGNEYKSMENFDMAIPDLNKAIELKPNYMEPHAILGDIYRQQAKYDLAMTNLNTAISIDPKSASALVNRGIVYAIIGKRDSARFDFDNAIKFKPEMFEAWGNRGNLNAMEQNREQAMSDYQHAIAINPDFKDAFRNMGLLSLELNKLDDAIGYFNQYIEIGSRETNRVLSPQIYFDLATAYSRKSDFVNAVNYAQQAKMNGYAVNEAQLEQWRSMIK
jgi:tetratricopeptide (TPR) repeat protein